MAGSGQYFQQIMHRLHFSSMMMGRIERHDAVLFIRMLPIEAGIGGISSAPFISMTSEFFSFDI